jgi:hypothetical protein
MKNCPYCGRENEETAIHCIECVTEFPRNIAKAESSPTVSASPTPAVPASRIEFVPLAPEDKGNGFVTLARCSTLVEAEMLVTRLDGAGFSTFIPDEFVIQQIPLYTCTYGFVRVQVPPSEYDPAKEFLTSTPLES